MKYRMIIGSAFTLGWIVTFTAGFKTSQIWDFYHQPRIVKPQLVHVGPYGSDDATVIRWYECDNKQSEIQPPMERPYDERESNAVRQQRYEDAIRCLTVGAK